MGAQSEGEGGVSERREAGGLSSIDCDAIGVLGSPARWEMVLKQVEPGHEEVTGAPGHDEEVPDGVEEAA